jgi:hypothetical protein
MHLEFVKELQTLRGGTWKEVVTEIGLLRGAETITIRERKVG